MKKARFDLDPCLSNLPVPWDLILQDLALATHLLSSLLSGHSSHPGCNQMLASGPGSLIGSALGLGPALHR